MSKFVVLVVGSRSYTNYDEFVNVMDYVLQNRMHDEICILSGGAKGADSLAERYALDRAYRFNKILPDWNRFGKSAGFKRNEELHRVLAHYDNRGCIAFWDGQSRGTAHNFALASQYNTPLRIFQIKK